MSCCSMAKKSSTLGTFASATIVQNGSPVTSVSRRSGSCPLSSSTLEMALNLSAIWRTFPGLQCRTSRMMYMVHPSHNGLAYRFHMRRGRHDAAHVFVGHEV